VVSKPDYKNIFKKHRFATIDPGITTAIQYWNDGVPGDKVVHKVPESKMDSAMGNRLDFLTAKMNFRHVQYVIIEAMDFRMGSARSMASAGRGNLSLLAYIIGAISHRAIIDNAIVLDPVTYSQWAGQLTYKQLRIVLEKKFGFVSKNNHEAAAYGIGLWARGDL
jgi:hypothetical protein